MTEEIKWYPDKTVGGITGWHWIETDRGAWDGPKTDFEDHHKRLILDMMEAEGRSMNCVIQAGGCQGMYPKLLAERFASVFTFEPDELNYQALVLNCQDNPRIFHRNAALGAEEGMVVVHRHTMDNVGCHTVEVSAHGTIPQLRIDDLKLSPDLIWLDVEGYEINILAGAQETIKRMNPVVVCERATTRIEQLLVTMGLKNVGGSVADSIFMKKS